MVLGSKGRKEQMKPHILRAESPQVLKHTQISQSSGVYSRDISYLLIRSSPLCQITVPKEPQVHRKQNTSEDPALMDRRLCPLFLRRAGSTHSQPQLFGMLNPNPYRYLFCIAQQSERSADTAATLIGLIPAASVCTSRLQQNLGSPGPHGSPYYALHDSQDLSSKPKQ